MFDIGFSEMLVIGVVALVVIGPQRLPKVARTLGHLVGRMQRYVNDVKADINREIELDELRKFKQEVEKTAQTFETAVREEVGKAESAFRSGAESVAGEVHDASRAISGAFEDAASTLTGPPAPAPAGEPAAPPATAPKA